MCEKLPGIAMCHGCGKGFCFQHFTEHRQNLSQRFEQIGLEHDNLHLESLQISKATDSELHRIDEWEIESISRVQHIAEAARVHLRSRQSELDTQINETLVKVKQTFQINHESNGYTELEIDNLTKQLEDLRVLLQNTKMLTIEIDPSTDSVIHLIKINDEKKTAENCQNLSVEEFHCESPNPLIICNRSQVTFTGNRISENSAVTGIRRYATGIHHLNFRIEFISAESSIFFGIVKDSENITPKILSARSIYGWWHLAAPIVNGLMDEVEEENSFRNGDYITLILNCDQGSIQLKHHRTQTVVELLIELKLCPLPWKLLIRLNHPQHSVKMISNIT